jgi:transcription antitermination factor NusG
MNQQAGVAVMQPAVLDPVSVFAPDARGAWHVLHVRSRQEKALADDLQAMDIAHYLPLVRQIRFYNNRKVTIEVPLFPGYVFLRGVLDEAYRADRTRRVVCIIPVKDQTQLNWELSNLNVALSSKLPMDPHPSLKKGVRVKVKAGPLRGLQGVVEDRSGSNRLFLQVEMLGRAVSVEMDGELLEVMD